MSSYTRARPFLLSFSKNEKQNGVGMCICLRYNKLGRDIFSVQGHLHAASLLTCKTRATQLFPFSLKHKTSYITTKYEKKNSISSNTGLMHPGGFSAGSRISCYVPQVHSACGIPLISIKRKTFFITHLGFLARSGIVMSISVDKRHDLQRQHCVFANYSSTS